MAEDTQKTSKRVVENCKLPITTIKIPEQWNREGPGKLDTLVESLKLHGQIVAITVRPGEKVGEYELVDGRRRILAMQEAGIKEAVATIVESADSTDAYAKSFVANMHRLQHDPVEISNVFATLNETMKNKEIAKLCGVSEGSVSQHLAIRKLPPKFLSALKKGTLLMSECRELCRLDPEEDAEFLDKIGSAMIEGTMDTFLGAEKISSYLEKKEEKATGKETKGKKKKAKAEGSGRQGHPVKVKDYTTTEIKEQVKLSNKTDAIAKLQKWSEKLAGTKSDANRRYIKGRLEGMEDLCGLRDD
jgi:ParB/RepB/Spo0J family partition protein